MSDYGVYEQLEVGSDSVGLQKAAKKKSLATVIHMATREFGSYLNGAYDRADYKARLSYILPEVTEMTEKNASFGDIPQVLQALAWNFDKKDTDDDDPDNDADDDSSTETDSDAKDDSDDGDGDDTPDFVDTDPDDDDSRKESRRRVGFGDPGEGDNYNYDDFNGNSGRYDHQANDPRWQTHPDAGSRRPTDADYNAWNDKNPDLHAWEQEQSRRRQQSSRGRMAGWAQDEGLEPFQERAFDEELNMPAGQIQYDPGALIYPPIPQGMGLKDFKATNPTPSHIADENGIAQPYDPRRHSARTAAPSAIPPGYHAPTEQEYENWEMGLYPDQRSQGQRQSSWRKRAEEDASRGFTQDLTDENLEPDPVDADFDGNVNDWEPSGFNAVGRRRESLPKVPRIATEDFRANYPIVARMANPKD